jgi:DNA-binding MarR family transcriptional regulator
VEESFGADALGRLRSSLMVLARRLRNTTLGNELSATAFSVLVRVHRDGPQTPGRLAKAEHVQPPTMTKIVEALESGGYLAREPHPDDGRRQLISVTPAGVAYIEHTREERNSWLLGRIEQLSESERATLAAAGPVLQRLAELP